MRIEPPNPSPKKKKKTFLGDMLGPSNWLSHVLLSYGSFEGQATRIDAAHVWNFIFYFLKTNCLEGRERKLDGAAKKVGRLCMHMYVHILCIISSFLYQNCMEPRDLFVRIL
jgi:hypothetical protein